MDSTNTSHTLPSVAIIVLNFNTPAMTDALVHYLNGDLNYPNKRVYVIDNGSHSQPASATHVLAENFGFTRGMYEGYKIASREKDYDAYWLLNSDLGFEYGNNVLPDLVEVLFSSDSFAQASPQHNSPHRFMENALSEAQPVPFLESTATLIKGSTIKALGFWDLGLTLGWGVDYDYGYRIRCAGLTNVLTNRARITHKEHRSIPDYSDYARRASAEMNLVLSEKYGADWGRITSMMRQKIVPLILSCDRDLSLTEKFIFSYRGIQQYLGRPLIVIDISSSSKMSSRYMALITSIDPRAVYIHSREHGSDVYNSVQEAVNFGLQRVLEESSSSDLVLFMEDDIIFSSRFLEKIESLEIPPDTGFISFYLPGNGYGSTVIDPGRFYGSQCVLFPRKAVEELVNHWEELKKEIPPGWDIRWSRFLGQRGYKLYCSDQSYVQHLQSRSRLHGHSNHVSNRFHA